MAKAKTYSFHESLYTMKELADQFNLSYCRMSNLMHKFNHDADTIYLQRNSKGAKRSGKNPKVYAVDLHGNTRMTVAEIAKTTGFSNAAISGKIKRGVTGSDLLKKKKIKSLYKKLDKLRSTIKKLPDTVRADKNKLRVVAEKGTTDIEDRLQIRNAVDDFLAGGGKIQKLQADGNINGQSWKDQAKKSWSKRKRKLDKLRSTVKKLPTDTVKADKNKLRAATKKEPEIDVRDMSSLEISNAVEDYLAAGGKIQKLQADGNIDGQSWKDQAKKSWRKRTTLASKKAAKSRPDEKGSTVNVNDFIAQLESERDQRKAYGEVLHLAASDEELTNLEHSLPETAFGEGLEKK